jgi:hypothetical protein
VSQEGFEGRDVGVGSWVAMVFKGGWFITGRILLLVIDIATGGLTYYIRNSRTGKIEKIDTDDVDYVDIYEDDKLDRRGISN